MASDFSEAAREIERDLSDRSHRVSPDALLHRLSIVANQIPDICLFVVQKKFFRDLNEETPNSNQLIMNYLSFRIEDGVLLRFEDRETCYSAYNKEESKARIITPNIILTAEESDYEWASETLNAVASIMAKLFQFHIYEGVLEASSNRFQKSMLLEAEQYSIDEMLIFVAQNYPVGGLSILECTFSSDSNKPTEIKMRDFADASLAVPDLVKRSLETSIRQSRPIDGFALTSDGEPLNYTILSASTQNWKALIGDASAQFVVLFSKVQKIDDFVVRFVRECLRRSLESDRPRQLEILKRLDQAKRELHRCVRIGDLTRESDRRRFIVDVTDEFCSRVYAATLAHSVTFRLFDPFNQKLRLISECSYKSGRYKESFETDISMDRTDSVNVITFREKGPNEYLYIPVLKRPMQLPGGVFNPRESASEVCFPIWQLGVPVGTLNVESPQRHAFGSDILFLQSAARLLGDILQSASDAIAPDAVAQISTANEIAHGSLELAEAGSLEAELLPITIRKKMEAYGNFLSIYRSPILDVRNSTETVSIRKLVREVITAELVDFRSRTLDWNKILPSIDEKISAFEAENIRSVIKSIVGNAEKHSSLPEDFLGVYLLRRSRYSFIVIKYRSDHRLAPIEAIEDYGLRPFVKDGRVSYGAFLLAARIRSMDGVLHVNRSNLGVARYAPLDIVIVLPLGKS